MIAVLIGLTGLIAPGFPQGLVGHYRAMAIVMGVVLAAIIAVAFTSWAMIVLPIVWVGSMIDGGLRYRRQRPNVRWSWLGALIAFVGSIVISLVARVFVVEAFKIPSSSMYPTLEIGDHIYVDKLSRLWHSPERGELIVFAQPCTPERDYISRVIAIENDTIEVRCSVIHINGTAVPTSLVTAATSYADYNEGFGDRDSEWFPRDVSRYHETIGDHSIDIFDAIDRPTREDQRRKEFVGDDQRDFPTEILRSCSNPDTGERPFVGTGQAPGRIVTTGEQRTQCAPFRHYVVPEGHVFVMGDNRSNSNDSRFWGSVPVDHIKGRVRARWLPLGRAGGIE